jgi:protein tyrosine/serine phosphatase
MARVFAWFMALVMVGSLVTVPYLYYRAQYNHAKRLRLVAPGVLYRSGQMTAAGLDEAIQRHQIRTVVNLQNEEPDPILTEGPAESLFCQQRGVKFVYIAPDLIDRRRVPKERPEAIAAFLAVMDDPANYPVLIHCQAGLHRTGVLAAVYRMEYDGWTARQALDELKANGFGDSKATARNDYIMQYILTYSPRSASSGKPTVDRRKQSPDPSP